MEQYQKKRIFRSLVFVLLLAQILLGRVALATDTITDAYTLDDLRGWITYINGNTGGENLTIRLQNNIVADATYPGLNTSTLQNLSPAYSPHKVVIDGQGHSISRGPNAADEFRLIVVGFNSAYPVTLELRNITLSGFKLTGYPGGALYVSGPSQLTLNNVVIFNNRVDETGSSSPVDGGAIYATNSAVVNITNSSIYENSASNGGAIAAIGGGVVVSNSDIFSNTAVRWGGGMYLSGAQLTLTKSIVDDNHASVGGGIYHSNTQSIVTSSTISDNSAYASGGIYAEKDSSGGSGLQITTSTISGNSGTIEAGGIYSLNQYINLYNTTVTNNTGGNTGGIKIIGETLYLVGSILAGNSGGDNAELSCQGGGSGPNGENVIASSPNLLSDIRHNFAESFSTGCKFLMGNNNIDASKDGNMPTAIGAMLKPLADNGCDVASGASGIILSYCTKTHGLSENSPALDKNSGNPNRIDQRGISPIGIADLGSFEGFIPDPTDETCYVIRAANGKTVIFCP